MVRILCRGRLLAALAITIGSVIAGWTPATAATLTVGKAAPNADPIIPVNVGDKRYVRRGKKGQFTTRQVNVGRSLSADRRSKAKRIAKKGEGDRGDRRSD